MAKDDPKTLVSTRWLHLHLADPDLRVLDGSWYLPADQRDVKSEYRECHIPGAQFFDIDEIADLESGLPHMAPPTAKFVSRMRAMGIGNGHQIVVYDSAGLFSAARVWWLYRLMGYDTVAVLDGGLKKWIAEGRPVEDLEPMIQERHFMVRRQTHLVRDFEEVGLASETGSQQIVDARSSGRFNGTAPEPREGLRSGSIPGSINVPFHRLLNVNGTMRPPGELKRIFEVAGVNLEQRIITSCGSGVTAAVLSLALEIIGHRSHSLYDGSWTEWGQRVRG